MTTAAAAHMGGKEMEPASAGDVATQHGACGASIGEVGEIVSFTFAGFLRRNVGVRNESRRCFEARAPVTART